MPKLLIIRGSSGVGKTTVTKKLAEKYRWELINYDMFFFGINKHKNKLKSDYKICFETVKECLRNCMKNERDIILEGALAPIDKFDVYNTNEIVKIARKYKYGIYRILLVCNEKISYYRMKKRHNVVKKWIYHALKKKINEEHHKEEITIDVSKITVKQLENKIEKLIKPKKD